MVVDQHSLLEIINFLPDATFVINREGRVMAWNKAIESLTGITARDVVGKAEYEYALPFYGAKRPILVDLVLNPSHDTLEDLYSVIQREGDTLVAEVFIPHLKPGGAYLWAKAAPLFDDAGEIVGAIETIRDITEQKQIQLSLQEQLHFLQVLLDAIPIPIFYKDCDGSYLGCNLALEKCLGLTRQQIVGQTVHEIVPKDWAERYARADQQLLQRQTAQSYESSVVYADGNKREVLFNKAAFLKSDGNLGGLVGTILNITELKRVEKALRESERKLRFLSSQLLTLHEQERRRLSRELHDELGQTLNVLKMQIGYMKKKLRGDQKDLQVDCEYCLDYIDDIIESVRRISKDLTPGVLVDLGLSFALRHLCEEFQKNYQIECACDVAKIDHFFPPDSQILIYRIFQESLNNIAKYAKATQVSLSIRKENRSLRFTIEDNGKGFDMEQVLATPSGSKGMGLAAMEERVRMLGGTLEVWSQEGLGTKISFALKI
jgi:PAS domain S-box-containing protein